MRWDDGYYKDADGGTLQGVMQPFMVGLLMQALVDVHRATSRPSVIGECQESADESCQHLYSGGPYRKDDTAYQEFAGALFTISITVGTTVNPKKFARGDGATAPPNGKYQVPGSY
jgi:hypothetical protein